MWLCQVTMENAENNQVHLSQSVPMSSPLTWKLTGDVGTTQYFKRTFRVHKINFITPPTSNIVRLDSSTR